MPISYSSVKHRQISLYTELPNTKDGVKPIAGISMVAILQFVISILRKRQRRIYSFSSRFLSVGKLG
jgi:hypothetical protein